MKKVNGIEYLYQRGDRYYVRVQVPSDLRKRVGRSELKETLGGDLSIVRKRCHSVIARFQGVIEAARRDHNRQPKVNDQSILDDVAIDTAVYDHFQRLAKTMRGKVAEPAGDSPRARNNRIAGFQRIIDVTLDAMDAQAWGTMSAEAGWLCEVHGWKIEPDSQLFELLCERMLRARLECYRREVRRLEGNFSEAKNADPIFSAPPKRQPNKTLGHLIDKFNSERSGDWSISTVKNYAIINRVLEEICGRGTPLASIDKDFCRNIRDLLCQLPSNYQKKAETKGRPLLEVIETAKARGMPLLAPGTINAHLNKFGAIIRFGRDEGVIVGNPTANIWVHDPIHPSEKRDPFSPSQLGAIFSAEPWDKSERQSSNRPSRYWAPLISLYSGARLGEIAGLLAAEIIERDGIPVIHIRHRPDRPVKGGRSRLLPVHPQLRRLGFLDFVDDQRRKNVEFLFPEEKPNSLGHWGDALSDWFGRVIRKRKLAGTRLTFHALRHSFEDALREVDLHDTPLGNALTGRSSGTVSRNYGSSFSTAKLAAAIERISFSGLSLDHLFIEQPASQASVSQVAL